MSAPLATIRAYRKAGGAIVTVERSSGKRRYRVTARRYEALKTWLARKDTRTVSGAWGSRNFSICVWGTNGAPAEFPNDNQHRSMKCRR